MCIRNHCMLDSFWSRNALILYWTALHILSRCVWSIAHILIFYSSHINCWLNWNFSCILYTFTYFCHLYLHPNMIRIPWFRVDKFHPPYKNLLHSLDTSQNPGDYCPFLNILLCCFPDSFHLYPILIQHYTTCISRHPLELYNMAHMLLFGTRTIPYR